MQSAATSTASVMMPIFNFIATRPATSLPKACETTRTAEGEICPMTCASASAQAATPWRAKSSDSMTSIFVTGP